MIITILRRYNDVSKNVIRERCRTSPCYQLSGSFSVHTPVTAQNAEIKVGQDNQRVVFGSQVYEYCTNYNGCSDNKGFVLEIYELFDNYFSNNLINFCL